MKLAKFILVFFLFSIIFAANKEIPRSAQLSKEEIALGDTLANLKDSLSSKAQPAVVSPNKKASSINLKEVFIASPIIYSTLLIMSVVACIILIYTLLTFRLKEFISKSTIEDIRDYLLREKYDEALYYCKNTKNIIAGMVASGLAARHNGTTFVIDAIKSSGRIVTANAWHRLSLLNDIVVIAPMLGLLGTVIGMFYAFYDINRSIDTLSALFDGLGIAVGTTVAGLLVAILTMTFHSILKYRMVKTLSLVENQAVALGNLIKK
jgi:biopolymer transport protein ExbB